VVSKAKLAPAGIGADLIQHEFACLHCGKVGLKGRSPAAIRSALTEDRTTRFLGKEFTAKVVLPAPLGPAMMTSFFPSSGDLLGRLMRLTSSAPDISLGSSRSRASPQCLVEFRQRLNLSEHISHFILELRQHIIRRL